MLNNLHVVITGAAGTLGQATAERARAYGARVTGLDIVDAETLANTDEYHQLNLLDREAAQHRLKSLGKIDALCISPGGLPWVTMPLTLSPINGTRCSGLT